MNLLLQPHRMLSQSTHHSRIAFPPITYCDGKSYLQIPPLADLIDDPHAGDMICSQCGLVVVERAIDVGAEWRTFAHDPLGINMSRVGEAENPLLDGGGDLYTLFRRTSFSDARQLDEVCGKPLYRNPHSRLSSSNSALIKAFRYIRQIAGMLHAPKSISDRANALYKLVVEKGDLRGHSKEVVGVACLFLACRQEGAPRTFKEVSAAARLPRKDVGKVFKKVIKSLDTSTRSVCVEDLLNRFCSNLHLDVCVQKMANHVATRALTLNLVGGRSPLSVAAAAIFMAAMACGVKKEKKEIGQSVGVAEATITATYRAMRVRVAELFPDGANFPVPLDSLPPT